MAPSPPGVAVGAHVPIVVEPYPDGDSMDAAMGLLGLTIGVPGRDMPDRYERERRVENQALWMASVVPGEEDRRPGKTISVDSGCADSF